MEAFGIFGFTFGIFAFITASYSMAKTLQLKKEVEQLRKRLLEPPGRSN